MAISKKAIEKGLTFFEKNLTYTPVTKTISNVSGDETFSDGTSSTIKGVFFRQEDVLEAKKQGLFNGADAVLLVKTSVTINYNDKITFDGEDYRIAKSGVSRYLGSTKIYKRFDCFKI